MDTYIKLEIPNLPNGSMMKMEYYGKDYVDIIVTRLDKSMMITVPLSQLHHAIQVFGEDRHQRYMEGT